MSNPPMDKEDRVVALIPARAGSARIPHKNVALLAGHPLLAYTIAAAIESGIFSRILVSTDSHEYAEIARYYGAEAPFLRPPGLAGSLSPDIDWAEHALAELSAAGETFSFFSILRPTSPFRKAGTILRAWAVLRNETGADSLRAVEPCRQHPGKMWVVRGARMVPLLPFDNQGVPWHSNPYQALPRVFVQNASLEIAAVRVVERDRSISGQVVVPFFTEGHEGFDVNHPADWLEAERLVSSGECTLPLIRKDPFPPRSN